MGHALQASRQKPRSPKTAGQSSHPRSFARARERIGPGRSCCAKEPAHIHPPIFHAREPKVSAILHVEFEIGGEIQIVEMRFQPKPAALAAHPPARPNHAFLIALLPLTKPQRSASLDKLSRKRVVEVMPAQAKRGAWQH